MPMTSHDPELMLHALKQKAEEARAALHHSAQRLTVLKGILELAVSKNGTIEELRLVSETALEEATRLSTYFDELRGTVRSCVSLLDQVECTAGGA